MTSLILFYDHDPDPEPVADLGLVIAEDPVSGAAPAEPQADPRWTEPQPLNARLAERLRRHTVIDDQGCWIWVASCNPRGYGSVKADGRTRSAHRVSYETFVGPIPEGLAIDHLCRVKRCINPEHLEPVTAAINNSRSPTFGGHKTHCIRGHEYTPANTITKTGRRGGRRSCRTCHNAARAARKRLPEPFAEFRQSLGG